MAIRQLNPYIHFNGEAEAALRFYERALGAKVEVLMRYGEAPMEVPDSHRERIIHAQLRIGAGVLMLGDAPWHMVVGPGDTVNGAIEVALEFTDRAEMDRAFAALAIEGRVEMPIQGMFWGGTLGMLVDRFGVHWMLMQVPAAAS